MIITLWTDDAICFYRSTNSWRVLFLENSSKWSRDFNVYCSPWEAKWNAKAVLQGGVFTQSEREHCDVLFFGYEGRNQFIKIEIEIHLYCEFWTRKLYRLVIFASPCQSVFKWPLLSHLTFNFTLAPVIQLADELSSIESGFTVSLQK